MKAYSLNDEDYMSWEDLVHEAHGNELIAGDTYYEHDCKYFEVSDILRVSRISDLIDDMMFNEIGETYNNSVSYKGLKELEEILKPWVSHYMNPERYLKLIGEKREVAFSEEDLQE